jgi:DNA-binding MarR family transcriptional regulator
MREAILQFDRAGLEELGLDGLYDAVQAAGIRNITDLVWRESEGVVLLQVDRPIDPATLDGVTGVTWWERLADSESGVTYLCELRIDHRSEGDVVARRVRGVDDGAVEVSVVGSQGDISRSVDALDEVGVDVLVDRLADYRGPRTPLDALTDRQREVLRTAHEMGYYEIPRAVATDAIAAELDLDPSTVVEHLQRAERNLLDDLLREAA